jgi:hypothetical protein
VLERWEAHGAIWRALTVTETLAVIELCTCYGSPVDELRSSDLEVIAYVAARPSSERGSGT